MLRIYDLKTEYLKNPLGIDSPSPRFSWKLKSDGTGVMQQSFRIVVSSEGELLWDSGVVRSEASVGVRYQGKPLHSRQRASWKVEVTARADNGREEAAVSETGSFEMGLLEEKDWQAGWIEPEEEIDEDSRKPALYLRRTFLVKKGLARARIYQTAHGLYHFWINGASGTEDCFKPGLTSYYHRIQYQVYDITSLLREGENVWAVELADGWWRGSTGGTVLNNYGYKLQFLGQMELMYADGSVAVIGSDTAFKWNTGGLLASDMQMGDIYDTGREPGGWKEPGFDDSGWKQVHRADDCIGSGAKKIASASVPVREREVFQAKVFTDKNGRTVLDFGQNIAGYVRMRLRNCARGQTVHLTHGEGLKDGAFSVENINSVAYPASAFQEVFYTCRGDVLEEYCPRFSVFGFRYVLLEGYEGPIQEGDFTAVAVYSAMEETGEFSCSNPLLNQLVRNSRWSQKGNFLDVPVDCPTRERNAWTGDAQVYVRTASIFMDTYTFYEKWLRDQTIEQYQSGKVGITFPSTSSVHNPEALKKARQTNPLAALAGPEGNGNIGEDAVGWGDSAVWLPYMVYLSFGDRQILENQYETARRWLEYELACARNHNPKYEGLPQYQHRGADGVLDAEYIYDTCFQYGEWQEPMEKTPAEQKKLMEMALRAKQEGKSILEIMAEDGKPEVATAYMYRSARNIAHMARILGKQEDAGKYEKLAGRIKGVYCTYLIGENGVIEKGHQAPYVRALYMGLYRDEEQKRQLLMQLLKEIQENDFCLNTGFLSTPFLLPVLADNGQTEAAYRILEQTKSPGWLHAVELGATTILEDWNGLDHFKASFNHYSFGAVCEFLFAYVAGIRPQFEQPGYREFLLQPVPGGSLTEAEASYESRYGRIVSGWKREEGTFFYHCTVPVNTRAHLSLPDGTKRLLGSGSYRFQITETSLAEE